MGSETWRGGHRVEEGYRERLGGQGVSRETCGRREFGRDTG